MDTTNIQNQIATSVNAPMKQDATAISAQDLALYQRYRGSADPAQRMAVVNQLVMALSTIGIEHDFHYVGYEWQIKVGRYAFDAEMQHGLDELYEYVRAVWLDRLSAKNEALELRYDHTREFRQRLARFGWSYGHPQGDSTLFCLAYLDFKERHPEVNMIMRDYTMDNFFEVLRLLVSAESDDHMRPDLNNYPRSCHNMMAYIRKFLA